MKKRILPYFLFLFFFGLAAIAIAQQHIYTPDNKNGNYTNPLLWGDWPDPDIIRVGDDFYFVSTSMHYVPGCPILKSKDLINWQMAGYAVQRFDEDPRYDLKGGNMYLRGSWAASIRHHNGLFYVGFCTPQWDKEKGHFSICTAKNIEGPWTRTIFPEYLYDPGLLFDDDGKIYVVHGQGKLYVTELAADARSVVGKPVQIWNKPIEKPDGSSAPYDKYGMEGSHAYKINGYYYITCPAGGTEGWQVCLRSKNIYGPYESKIIAQDESTYPNNGLHQGGMVQLKNGDWWFIIMQDRGPFGRVPNLLPVVWKDGWPMLGKDGNGKGLEVYGKPNVGQSFAVAVPATSDEFNSPKLGLQWQWNHNPDNKKWSLKNRPGYLSISASYAGSLKEASNSLSQRVQGPQSSGMAELDVSGLKDGDNAGLAVFQFPYAFVGVQQIKNQRQIVMINDGKTIAVVPHFKQTKIWLRASAGIEGGGTAGFAYSTDGRTFHNIGDKLKMGLGLDWTANRFMLFNFNSIAGNPGGNAYFNWFHFSGINSNTTKARISYNGDCMKIDGDDVFIYSAAFHYFRVPKPLWRDRLAKIKAAGFNTVETYIPWNITELNMPKNVRDQSQFDFTDIKDFLKIASDEFGLYVIARPGPFICAEWGGGGYPRWLAKYKPAKYSDEFWLRSNDSVYIQWSKHWFNAIDKVLLPYQVTNRHPGSKGIIMEQIENEYDYQDAKDKAAALKTFYQTVRNDGIDIPLFSCLTNECRGSQDEVLKNVFDAENLYVGLKEAPGCAQRIAHLKQQQPNAPAYVTELQGGWFSLTKGSLSEDNYSDYRHYQAITLMSMLGGATGLNTYMFVGGTNFAGWAARGQTTTYDYNAPVHENGSLSKKYEVARQIGTFIRKYGAALVHAKGGPCTLIDGVKSLYGGVRVSPDGTKFVFLHNTDPDQSVAGTVTLMPGILSKNDSVYNIDQNGQRVLIKTGTGNNDTSLFKPFRVTYQLSGLGSKVLVIPPGKKTDEGMWWFGDKIAEAPSIVKPVHMRMATVWKRNEDHQVQWVNATRSLPEMGVNDCRYVLYRSSVTLREEALQSFSRLLFNTYSRDIIDVQINGKIARRLAPSEQYAAEATRNLKTSFQPIKDNEFDNAFDVTGLMHEGKNEIVALYENIGHEHGYQPMEQLCGIKTAGLSDTLNEIKYKLDWQVSNNVSGVENKWTDENIGHENWAKVKLDTITSIPRKGNNIQPKGRRDALMTWYRAEFEMPKSADCKKALWRLLINASGNGYIYLNGHNLGRYWEIGPQREFYLPECWLNFDSGKKNVISISLRQTINGGEIKAMEIGVY